eukprot:m.55619 g.55619  ORF g.55619 m.55619 type:complete len:59 (+) comp34494_c0_seq1:604-780(+)
MTSFNEAMKGFRTHYKVYSRWPITNEGANQIRDRMATIMDNADLIDAVHYFQQWDPVF